ncbi:uncharacterized protein KY384_001879 [Bacidia gigantensis]|uniref:uncharacterized protein n=1 Tax=Bacidia gigantensis TaxID=2732470 RepID=UPI001D045B32|nr:uncharacterized protein KY384_001879 [Bacidia gigantensis]KAG8533096.1 hypothetical protein KY384_001879 [Bacidia gigantensis]
MSSTATTISSPPSSAQMGGSMEPKDAHINIESAQSTPVRRTSPHQNGTRRPPLHHHNTADEYFVGPADLERFTKLPDFLRMHGSITPRMILPLTFVGIWSTLITLISHLWFPLVVNSLLLTVLGFVVGLGISFRTSSAYERYVDGRRFWAQLSQSSRDLARHIWIHADERHEKTPEAGKTDLLAKISALNLIVAFAIALKHKLRFEPYTNHEDLAPLISHLDTFAGEATNITPPPPPNPISRWKRGGEYLGLSFAESNPRKQMKRARRNMGNLPLEILTYLSAYTSSIVKNGTLDAGVPQAQVLGNLASLNEVLAGTERVLNTPLPVAYSIAISQITWVYVLMLPFQLWDALRWITIPGTIIGAYIILGISAIGREIENPFGHDVNDLPLENFCKGLADEVNVIMARPRPTAESFGKGVGEIRESLRRKAERASAGDGNERVHERVVEKVMRHVPV